MSNQTRAAAAGYLSRGWVPIPLRPVSKRPVPERWEQLTRERYDLDGLFPPGCGLNVGISLGAPSGGLIDADLDCAEARRAAAILLPTTGMIWGRRSAPDSHRGYVVADPPAKASHPWSDPLRKGKGARLLELRSTGGQTVAPPSILPGDGDGKVEEPCVWSADSDPAGIHLDDLMRAANRVAVAALLARYWRETTRHDCALALAGGLLRAGWLVEEAGALVRAVCAAAGDTEAGDRERAVRDTAAALATGEHATGWPTLERLLGEGGGVVVATVRRWLGICAPSLTAADGECDPARHAAPGGAQRPPGSRAVLVTRMAASITEEAVDWLWPGRFPLGMLSIIDGDPGTGKSLITLALAAAVSRGTPVIPHAPVVGPAGVMILPAEDDAARTVVPRLRAAGANLDRVHIVDEVQLGDTARPVQLPEDLRFLREYIERNGVRLVVFDPIMGYLSGLVDSHKDQSARDVLSALRRLAEETGVAIVMIRHLNKRAGDAALYRGGGSIAFTAAARSALVVGRVPDRPGVLALAVAKCNLAAPVPAVTYHVGTDHDSAAPLVEWGEEMELSADDLLPAAPPRRAGKRAEAEKWLREQLQNGPVAADELFKRAAALDLSEGTLRRAADELGVVKDRKGFQGGSRWSLSGHSRQLSAEDTGVGGNGESSGKGAESPIPTTARAPSGNGKPHQPLPPDWRLSLPPDGR
jgi:hypothetical protein